MLDLESVKGLILLDHMLVIAKLLVIGKCVQRFLQKNEFRNYLKL